MAKITRDVPSGRPDWDISFNKLKNRLERGIKMRMSNHEMTAEQAKTTREQIFALHQAGVKPVAYQMLRFVETDHPEMVPLDPQLSAQEVDRMVYQRFYDAIKAKIDRGEMTDEDAMEVVRQVKHYKEIKDCKKLAELLNSLEERRTEGPAEITPSHHHIGTVSSWEEVYEKARFLFGNGEFDYLATVSLDEYKQGSWFGTQIQKGMLETAFKLVPTVYPGNEKFELFVDERETNGCKIAQLVIVYLKPGEKL